MLYTVNRKIPVQITLTPKEAAGVIWDFTSDEQVEMLEHLFDEIEPEGFENLSGQLQAIMNGQNNVKTLFMMRKIAEYFDC